MTMPAGTTTTTTTTSTSTDTDADGGFAAPGPGTWERDASHCPPAPTRVFRRVASTTMPDAYREVFATFGAPLETMDVRFVHGTMYRRLVPLVGADRDAPKPPPKPVLWLAVRLHPEFRRRTRAAAQLWKDRPDRAVVEHWERVERDDWFRRNADVQAIDPAGLDDRSLADHLEQVDAHVIAGWRRHHVLHGSDIGPIGDLLVHARQWGVDEADVFACLLAASPATREASEFGRSIAESLRRHGGVDPATVVDLDAVRAVPDAAHVLDQYLAGAAWRVVTSYDIEGLTIGEAPSATCAIIRANADIEDSDRASEADAAAHAARVRVRVPEAERATFDELLARARQAYGMRDDNGPLTAEWPMGLLRRAFLEAGRRLCASGRLDEPAYVFELDTPEVAAALRGEPAPDAAEAQRRAAERRVEATLDGPPVLGPAAEPPDTSVLPAPIRRTMDLVLTAVALLEVDPALTRQVLRGTGIGTTVHRGIARVADDPDRLLAQMEPGDVLVAPWTAPTYNSLFAIAGAVVVREGGPLCHAAVMARELGIPTVIGCHGAMTEIHDGDLVEVDPVGGEVRVLTER